MNNPDKMDINNDPVDKTEETSDCPKECLTEDRIKSEDLAKAAENAGARSGNAIKKLTASIFDIFEMFAICTMAILLVFSYIGRLTVVEGGSMLDTLHNGDYMIVQDIGYTPERGDIVVIHKINAPNYPNPIIKRVIAVAGDTVDIDFSTWTVYVNDKAIDEPYVNLEGYVHPSQVSFPLTVEEGKIFVMGDHRNHSSDSRVAELGQIDVRCVVGRAVLRILPFKDFGVMNRAEYD